MNEHRHAQLPEHVLQRIERPPEVKVIQVVGSEHHTLIPPCEQAR